MLVAGETEASHGSYQHRPARRSRRAASTGGRRRCSPRPSAFSPHLRLKPCWPNATRFEAADRGGRGRCGRRPRRFPSKTSMREVAGLGARRSRARAATRGEAGVLADSAAASDGRRGTSSRQDNPDAAERLVVADRRAGSRLAANSHLAGRALGSRDRRAFALPPTPYSLIYRVRAGSRRRPGCLAWSPRMALRRSALAAPVLAAPRPPPPSRATP